MTSKKTPASPLELVTGLMQERLKFETWLAALEQRRAATPPNVYDRVRADYQKRLAAVVTELKAHARELEEQAERFTARLAELAEREQEQRDERAEAELRSQVGELSDEDWNATAAASDELLAAIAAEQAVVGADLNRVHEMLGAATGSGAATAAPAAAEPPSEPESAAAPAPPAPAIAQVQGAESLTAGTPAGDPPPVAPAEPTRPEPASFDELAFLKSVVSPVESRSPVEPPKPAVKPGRSSSGVPIEPDPAEELGEQLVSRAGRASQERAFIREDAGDAASQLVGRNKDPERLGDRPFAANVTGNNPIVLRPSGAVEQPKTLKCAECGAMNYPTEWYCERCGAELASL